MIKTIRNDLFVVFILLFSGWKYTYGLQNFLDIALYDESNYLYWGVKLNSFGLPIAEGGLLYSVWYYILSLFQPENIELYYLNYKIITVLLPILLYFVLRRYSIQIIPSIMLSFFFLISHANFPLLPKVSHFSLIIVLLFLVFMSYVKKSLLNSLAIACIGTLFSAYVRPELFLAFLFLCLIYIGILGYTFRKQKKSVFTIFVGFVLVSGILIFSLGVPIGGNRSLMAFGQHFSLNWVQWTSEQQLSPWTNWQEIIHLNFGDIHSITEAVFNNPRLFFKHIISNLVHTPQRLGGLFFDHANLILPDNFKNIEAYLLLGLFAVYLVRTKNRWFSQLHDRVKENQNLFIIFGCYLIVSFMSVIIIFPRVHYLLLPGVLIIISVAILMIGNEDKRKNIINYKKLVFLGLIAIALR